MKKNLKQLKWKRYVKKVDGGYIVGLNGGEFGGGLLFVSADGMSSYEVGGLLRIRDIFEWNSKIYALEGIAHLGMSRGRILEIYNDKVWKYKTIKVLEEAPSVVAKGDKQLVLATSQYLYRLTEDLQVEEILKAPFYWGILYPSSIHIDRESIYLAMRQGILKIENFQTSPTYKWYIKE